MQPARDLRRKLASNELTVGMLVTDHVWNDLVELAAQARLDYLIIDMEHGPASTQRVAEVLATGRRLGFPLLLRPRANDYAALRLAADLGPCGFLLPGMETASDLDVVRDAVWLPPRGRRRPGGLGNRWVGDFSLAAWNSQFEQDFLVLPQIETRRGLENVDDIARHELTTALALGPYDLSVDLGVAGDMNSAVLGAACRAVRDAAHSAGKPAWMIGSDGPRLVRDGWRFICLGEVTEFLRGALRQAVDEVQRCR
jgi:2-keto-3-deoxy-L-rhamnonate aldolase RhmA